MTGDQFRKLAFINVLQTRILLEEWGVRDGMKAMAMAQKLIPSCIPRDDIFLSVNQFVDYVIDRRNDPATKQPNWWSFAEDPGYAWMS